MIFCVDTGIHRNKLLMLCLLVSHMHMRIKILGYCVKYPGRLLTTHTQLFSLRHHHHHFLLLGPHHIIIMHSIYSSEYAFLLDILHEKKNGADVPTMKYITSDVVSFIFTFFSFGVFSD